MGQWGKLAGAPHFFNRKDFLAAAVTWGPFFCFSPFIKLATLRWGAKLSSAPPFLLSRLPSLLLARLARLRGAGKGELERKAGMIVREPTIRQLPTHGQVPTRQATAP